MKRKVLSSATKSLIITAVGYICTSLAAFFVVYPMFGITVVLSTALYLGIILTAIAYVSNYCCMRMFEYLESKGDDIEQ